MATLLGTTGLFGFSADQAGIIIETQTDRSRSERKFLRTRQGDRMGFAGYDESVEFTLGGAIPTTGAFSTAINSAVTVTNALPYTHIAATTGGTVALWEVQNTANIEEFKQIEINGELLPGVTA